MGELTSGKKSRKKARKIGLLELTFYVFSRILNLQIHAHIYRSFICHHKMLGVRIAKRQIEPQKPANPCGARLCSCIFFVNTLQKSIESRSFRCFFYCKNCVHARRYMPIPTITARSTSVMTAATSKCLLESASAPSRSAPERRIFLRTRHSALPFARREVSRMI